MRRRQIIPGYRKHKASGQAVVTLSGVDHYLGIHGTQASKNEYDRVTAEWLARGRTLPRDPDSSPLTVRELVLAYFKHAEARYKGPDGKPTREVEHVRRSLKPVRVLYGTTPAKDFGPDQFEAVRGAMVREGLR